MEEESQSQATEVGDEDKIEKNDIRNVPKGILKEFIDTYRAHPALWQIQNKELYQNRNLKNKGYIELLKIWKKFDPDADQKAVKQKIQSIRGSFRKEFKKVEKSERSGKGVDETYKSHLWYFKLLMFLVDHELPTSSFDNINESSNGTTVQESVEEVDEPNQVNESNEGTTHNVSVVNTNKRYASADGHGPAQKKKISEDRERKLFLAKCTEALQSKPTESDALGQYISTKLEKVTNPEQRMYAEALLTKVLNKAIMGQLNEFSDVTLRTSHYPSTNFAYVSSEASVHSSLPTSFPSPSLSSNYCTDESAANENLSPMESLRTYYSSAGHQ